MLNGTVINNNKEKHMGKSSRAVSRDTHHNTFNITLTGVNANPGDKIICATTADIEKADADMLHKALGEKFPGVEFIVLSGATLMKMVEGGNDTEEKAS